MLFRGVAVKPIIAPTSIEALLAGLRLMLAGAGKFTVRAALVPQPAKAKIKVRTETPPNIETHNLPMNPPRLRSSTGEHALFWKISSVEA